PEGAILNVSSMGSFIAVPGQTVYGASKAAVAQFTAGLWAELRDTNVQVTVVMPGGVNTGIAENSGAHTKVMDAAEAPMQLTTPADAARQIVEGVERGSYRVLVGKDSKALDLLTRLMPKQANGLIAKKLASLVE
ncbi:MAG: SDR family NAD(P)-dependent oxidoreductase, partial [Nocardioides sp.]|uniref:SDR family NAD(P)-dependent oxidoreductase n=1 Tax=Nocardioides sp. TaxID=35761 RepID=UPI003F0C16DA